MWVSAPAWADEADTEGEEESSAEPASDLAPAYPGFPDPVLMKRARTYRAVGVTLSVLGGVSLLVSFNVSLAVIRSGNEDQLNSMNGWLIPMGIVTGIGLQLGAPLWTVGGEMVRQLTRNTRGDEKLRREVANDRRYWQGRTMNAFGTSMALTGGLSVVMGALMLVGGIWVVQREAEFAEAGIAPSPNFIGVPIAVLGGGAAVLVAGLEIRKAGLERAERVREAYATTQLIPVPFVDPVGRSAGLVVAGRF
ncbi:MAG: hypothetical protein QGH45_16265 [Myxococcota bacterium]|nr:hypothetical protein [Myxococcota bacterium]